MPISLTVTEGVLPKGAEIKAAQRITHAFLKWHDLSGNKTMTPNVTDHIHVIPEGHTLSGGEPFSGAWVEVKAPNFALSDRSIQEGFFKEAMDIIVELSENTLPRDHVHANAIHTVDGTWNMDGRAMTNEQLGEAVSRG
jgi:hypothetical protein